MKVYIDTNNIPTMQLKVATLRKHYLSLLKRDFVLKDTVKRFTRDLETIKYCPRTIAIILLLCTTILSAQGGVVVAGKTQNNVSYTIGAGLVELQIPVIEEEVSLGVPKFEIPIEKPKPIIKKKSFIEKLIDFFKKLIKK